MRLINLKSIGVIAIVLFSPITFKNTSAQSCSGGSLTISSEADPQSVSNSNFCLVITPTGSIVPSVRTSRLINVSGPRDDISGVFITNNGSLTYTLEFDFTALYGIDSRDASISSLSNAGSINVLLSGQNSTASGIRNSGTIISLTNTNLIEARAIGIGTSGGRGVDNSGTIITLTNSGTIYGNAIGIRNQGEINFLTNLGEIQVGIGGYGIVNAGTIGELNNAQGGTQPLTYSGPLPTNYNVIIYGPSSYGKLEVTSPGFSQTRFGIYGGSLLSNGTYSSVLKGVTRGNLYAVTGTYGSATWSLINSSGTIWDLLISGIVTGPSTADTQQSLANTASVLQGTFTLQNSVMVNGFTYDCSLFDKRGICVSAGGRNTTVQAQGINNTSGLLIASYRLDKNNSRIGAWVDQNLSVSGPGTVKLGNSTPMIGLFGVWSQRPDGVGAEVKVSAAYGQKDTTITRQVVGTSEAGSGGSQLISQGAQVVAKYGFAVLPDVVVSPYAGVRYTQNNMGGYTEATSSAVTAPLTYSALNTNATTALAGAEARYRGIPKTTLFASAGVETDTNTSNGSYSATGITGLTPVNFNPNPVKTRPTATVGGYYDILKNQRIGVTGIYRQEPFQAVSTTTVLATYTIGL
jgi:Autotransporter beta-domain